jgi:hypothetical protein
VETPENSKGPLRKSEGSCGCLQASGGRSSLAGMRLSGLTGSGREAPGAGAGVGWRVWGEIRQLALLHPVSRPRRHAPRSILIALWLGLIANGCAPPPFTVGFTADQAVRNNYFDVVLRGKLPSPRHGSLLSEEEFSADYIRSKIVANGDNRTERLSTLVTEAGGTCGSSGTVYRCEIDRRYISNSCAMNRCTRSKQHWNLKISWDSRQSEFKPQVKVVISLPELIDRNY